MAIMRIATPSRVHSIRNLQTSTCQKDKNIAPTTPNLRQNKKHQLPQTDLNKRKNWHNHKNYCSKTRKKQTLFQIHHIIPQHLWKDSNTKEQLQKLGLTKDSKINTVVLPTKRYKILPTIKKYIPQKFKKAINRIQYATLHRGNHNKKYYNTISSIINHILQLPVDPQTKSNKLYKFLASAKNKLKKGEISLRRVNKHKILNNPKTPDIKEKDYNDTSEISIIEQIKDINNNRIYLSFFETSEIQQEEYDDISDIYIAEQLNNIAT